jgi:hypothetical protein
MQSTTAVILCLGMDNLERAGVAADEEPPRA